MTILRKEPKFAACLTLLQAEGIVLSHSTECLLEKSVELVKEWNPIAGLVSRNDERAIVRLHLIDSLSLLPVIIRCRGRSPHLLDIGSGGGFPAIPLKILQPEMRVTLVERTERKIGFLRAAVVALGLSKVQIVHGDFPHGFKTEPASVITARAVEKPQRVLPKVLAMVSAGAVFLCQHGQAPSVPEDMFHVEHVRDEWARQGLRRGSLYVVIRRT